MLTALLVAATVIAPASAVVERRLYPAELTSSSFLWTDWNQFQENYHPNYIGDDDPKTAWVEGAKGTGVGEWIRIKVTAMDGASKARLSIRNGYQKSDKLFRANGRPAKILVTLLPSKTAKEVTLADKEGTQDVVVEQPAGALDTIEIKIVSVYPGTKYEDTCISDVGVYVTASTRENPAYEKTLFDKLQAWRKERVDTAKLFKEQNKGQIPVASGYSFTGDGWETKWPQTTCGDNATPMCVMSNLVSWLRKVPGQKHEAAIALAESAIKAKFAGFEPVQAVPTDKRFTPIVDHVCTAGFVDTIEEECGQSLVLPHTLGLLRASTVGTFAIKDAPVNIDAIVAADSPSCQSKTEKSFAWAKLTKPADGPERVSVLFIASCALVCSRDGLAPAGTMQLLVYDAKGNLELYATDLNAQVFEWSDDGKQIVAGSDLSGVAKAITSVAGN
jgi:hypothetical protein